MARETAATAGKARSEQQRQKRCRKCTRERAQSTDSSRRRRRCASATCMHRQPDNNQQWHAASSLTHALFCPTICLTPGKYWPVTAGRHQLSQAVKMHCTNKAWHVGVDSIARWLYQTQNSGMSTWNGESQSDVGMEGRERLSFGRRQRSPRLFRGGHTRQQRRDAKQKDGGRQRRSSKGQGY